MSNVSPLTRFPATKGQLSQRKRTSLKPARWTHIHLLSINARFPAASWLTLNPPPLSDAETTIILNPPLPMDHKFTSSELSSLNGAAHFLYAGFGPRMYLRHLLNHFFRYAGCHGGAASLHVEYENRKVEWRPLAAAANKGVWAVAPEIPKSHMAEEAACFVAIMLASPEAPAAPLLFTVRHRKVLLLRSRRNERYLNRLLAGKLQKEDELVVERLAVWDVDFSEQRLELAKVAAVLARSEDTFAF